MCEYPGCPCRTDIVSRFDRQLQRYSWTGIIKGEKAHGSRTWINANRRLLVWVPTAHSHDTTCQNRQMQFSFCFFAAKCTWRTELYWLCCILPVCLSVCLSVYRRLCLVVVCATDYFKNNSINNCPSFRFLVPKTNYSHQNISPNFGWNRKWAVQSGCFEHKKRAMALRWNKYEQNLLTTAVL